jgi:hypothetical protein
MHTTINFTHEKTKLLLNLENNKKELKKESDYINIIMQQQLQSIMLAYIIDIEKKLELVENDLASNYPTELISSLKIITDLYLKMKQENKGLHIAYKNDYGYVF